MNNAIIKILDFEDLFSDDIINKKDKSILFLIILNKLISKYHFTWFYCYEEDKDYPSLGFVFEEDYRKKIIMNHSKNFEYIKLKFYSYSNKEIKAILRYIKICICSNIQLSVCTYSNLDISQ